MNLPTVLDKSSGIPVYPLVWEHKQPDMEQLSAEYAHKAFSLNPNSETLIHLLDMPGMVHARAAVLGARQTGSRLLVWLQCDEEGKMADGFDIMAALICIQELGIEGFGLVYTGADTQDLVALVKRLGSFAHIPIAIGLDKQTLPKTGKELVQDLCKAGACSFCLHPADLAQRLELERVAQASIFTKSFESKQQPAPILVTSEAEVYFLEEDYTLSPPIECALDMSDAILEAEEQGYDALLIHVQNIDDAYNFGRNAHMLRCAACILADGEEALEAALLHFNGRAIVDARSDVEENTMRALAKGYGALIR